MKTRCDQRKQSLFVNTFFRCAREKNHDGMCESSERRRWRATSQCVRCGDVLELNSGIWWTRGTCKSTCNISAMGVEHEAQDPDDYEKGVAVYEMCSAALTTGPGTDDYVLCRGQARHTGLHSDGNQITWYDKPVVVTKDPDPVLRGRGKSAAAKAVLG